MKKVFISTVFVLFMMSTMSYAYQIGDYYVGGHFNTIYSVIKGSNTTVGGGSIMDSYLNGVKVPYDYCVDLFTEVYVPKDYKYSIITNDATIHGSHQITNYQQVAWLLDNYADASITDKSLQIALQAAIWTEINGSSVYSLNTGHYSGTSVDTYYTKMMKDLLTDPVGNVSHYYWITPKDSCGTQYQAQVTDAPVPEPSTCLLFGAGIAGVAFWRRRSKK